MDDNLMIMVHILDFHFLDVLSRYLFESIPMYSSHQTLGCAQMFDDAEYVVGMCCKADVKAPVDVWVE